MKRALIHKATRRLCQVELQDFPVHPDLEWRDCPDDVTPETHDFDGALFVGKPVPTPKTVAELAVEAVDAMDRLQNTLLFRAENDIRALREKINLLLPGTFTVAEASQITRAQFRDRLITMMTNILSNP